MKALGESELPSVPKPAFPILKQFLPNVVVVLEDSPSPPVPPANEPDKQQSFNQMEEENAAKEIKMSKRQASGDRFFSSQRERTCSQREIEYVGTEMAGVPNGNRNKVKVRNITNSYIKMPGLLAIY